MVLVMKLEEKRPLERLWCRNNNNNDDDDDNNNTYENES